MCGRSRNTADHPVGISGGYVAAAHPLPRFIEKKDFLIGKEVIFFG